MLQYSTILNKGQLRSDYLMEDIYNLLDKTFQIPDHFTFQVLEVTDEYIARPDLISYDAYGDTRYTDIICKINGICNPFELNSGMKLLLPEVSYISSFVITPDIEEMESSKDVIIPKPKTKQTKKRKANEAVIGDRRFKIDSGSGIIIY